MSRMPSTSLPSPAPHASPASQPRTALTQTDLAELLSSFNEVTARLQSSHEQLRGEVARLSAELRDANEQLERSRRLAALGEMAAGIAHEVRNPLGSIRLYARMLEEDLAAHQAQAALATKITNATRVVEAIVGDVLSFAREFRLRPQPVCASDLFEKALDLCKHDGVPGWRAVEVTFPSRQREVEVNCDPSLLQQVLVNLVRNAADAMRAVPAESRRLLIQASWPEEEGRIAVEVRDHGTGVAPDVAGQLFSPFVSTKPGGMGMGLTICRSIMELHGGSITYAPAEDGGSVFRFTLAVAEAGS